MSWLDTLFVSRARFRQAQREAQERRAMALAKCILAEEESERASAGAKSAAAESSALSRTMRSVMPSRPGEPTT